MLKLLTGGGGVTEGDVKVNVGGGGGGRVGGGGGGRVGGGGRGVVVVDIGGRYSLEGF